MIYLRDVADWRKGTSIGEYDRINQQRYITVTSNILGKDLGTAVADVNKNISALGNLPAGVKIYLRGQSVVLNETQYELSTGLLLAVIVILLMLTAFFQSFRLSLVVVSVIPGILAGSLLLLFITGNSMNIQSFMGCIMAVGIGISNAVLLISNAQTIRSKTPGSGHIGAQAASNRFRPIAAQYLKSPDRAPARPVAKWPRAKLLPDLWSPMPRKYFVRRGCVPGPDRR